MPSDVTDAWAEIEGMLHGVIASLPNIGVALLVFGLCYGHCQLNGGTPKHLPLYGCLPQPSRSDAPLRG